MSEFVTEPAIADAPASHSGITSDVDKQREEWNAKFAEQDKAEAERTKAAGAAKDAPATEGEQKTAQEIADELAEIAWNDGKTYKVPAVFKDILTKADSLDKDYTFKTQQFANERKQIEETLKAEMDRLEGFKAHIRELAEGESIKAKLDEYDKIDWLNWAAQDPTSALKHQAIRNELKNRMDQIAESVRKAENERTQHTTRAKQVEIIKAQERVRELVKDWSPEVARKVTDYAVKELGVPMEVLNEANRFPNVVVAFYKMMMQHQAVANAQPQNLPKTPAQPVPKVGGSAPSAKNPDEMGLDDWLKWRNKDIQGKRAQGARIH